MVLTSLIYSKRFMFHRRSAQQLIDIELAMDTDLLDKYFCELRINILPPE